MPESGRQHERVKVSIPVFIDGGGQGETVNLSPAGVYFVTDRILSSTGPVRFTLEFDSPAGKLYLECAAEIVRVDKGEGKVRVAARITESRLERKTGQLAPPRMPAQGAA